MFEISLRKQFSRYYYGLLLAIRNVVVKSPLLWSARLAIKKWRANAKERTPRLYFGFRNRLLLMQAGLLIDLHPKTALLVTLSPRPRELKIASGLRVAGWKTILLYCEESLFDVSQYVNIAIKIPSEAMLIEAAHILQPRICHVFCGSIDTLTTQIMRNKPAPVILDLNDIFTKTLFNAMQERFEPTLEAIAKTDAFCARDLQIKFIERAEKITIPEHMLLFPEYCWRKKHTAANKDPNGIHVVSVGTFTLETQGMYDSAQLEIARRLTAQKIHFHIYPHWFYRKDGGPLADDFAKDFRDFLELERQSTYMHVHESQPLDKLADILPQYDFGIIAGGSEKLGQKLAYLSKSYMMSCYSGRIADFLDARLPILINREVDYNFKLLKHYGIGVDLDWILEPDFYEKLLSIKQDPMMKKRLERAAHILSLNYQSRRISAFYDHVIAATPVRNLRLPSIAWMRTLPFISSYILSFSRKINEMHTHALDAVSKQKDLNQTPLTGNSIRQLRLANQELEVKYARLKDQISLGNNTLNRVSNYLNWPELTDDLQRMNGFAALMRMIAINQSSAFNNISAAWEALSQKHFDDLLVSGYASFKKTIALHYFTFPITEGDPQLLALERLVTSADIELAKTAASLAADDPSLTLHSQWHYRYFTALLWLYACKIDFMGHANLLREPNEGSPILVKVGDKAITQDLANSLIEYYSIQECAPFGEFSNVLEIGAGYGRNAFVTASLHPHIKYIIVDIPPALFIAQRYLSRVFPERRVFYARDFASFDGIKEAFEQANFVFLLPHQITLLPPKIIDLVINISSFGEMRKQQVDDYFFLIDRICRGFFYFKQWKKSPNPFDKLELQENDYPKPSHWHNIYHRECSVQTEFFEALYAMSASPHGDML